MHSIVHLPNFNVISCVSCDQGQSAAAPRMEAEPSSLKEGQRSRSRRRVLSRAVDEEESEGFKVCNHVVVVTQREDDVTFSEPIIHATGSFEITKHSAHVGVFQAGRRGRSFTENEVSWRVADPFNSNSCPQRDSVLRGCRQSLAEKRKERRKNRRKKLAEKSSGNEEVRINIFELPAPSILATHDLGVIF